MGNQKKEEGTWVLQKMPMQGQRLGPASKSTDHICSEIPLPTQVRCSLRSTFHNDMLFFPLCWTCKPWEQLTGVKNPSKVAYAYLKPHLITAEENLSSLTAIACTWLRRLRNALHIKGMVIGWSSSGSTMGRAEVLFLERTYRRNRSKGCPEVMVLLCGQWAAGSVALFLWSAAVPCG